jgi:hypothetical protein
MENDALNEYYKEINMLNKDNTAIIKLFDGTSLSLSDVYISADSTTGSLDHSDSLLILETSHINSITHFNHTKGAFGGFTIGLLIGFTARLIQYTFWTPDEKGEGLWPLIEFMYVPAIGAGIGLVTGAILGEKNEYVINESNQ